jgi:hypothetical protein
VIVVSFVARPFVLVVALRRDDATRPALSSP